MLSDEIETRAELRALTADVVSSYLSNNAVHGSDLPRLIATVHGALVALRQPPEPAIEKPVAPVSVKKSITPEYLISMEDGRQYKSLRRHLSTRGMTPEQYRAKWGLPGDYPMTAPATSAKRSQLAKSAGLGQSRQRAREAAEAAKKPTTRRQAKKAA